MKGWCLGSFPRSGPNSVVGHCGKARAPWKAAGLGYPPPGQTLATLVTLKMAERKVLNKYFPPDYDPERFPSLERSSKKSGTVRLMAPFSMRCNTCGEFIYKSKKFNARKENTDEDYLGIQILRFYIKCPRCASEITFKTDPKNTDYTCEKGATRNYEPWKEEKQSETTAKKHRLRQEEGNPLVALENKTADSKRELEIYDALDEIRAINARNEKRSVDSALAQIVREEDPPSEVDSDAVVSFRREQLKRKSENTATFLKGIFRNRP